MSKTYGYIRVSSREQNEERQRIALLDWGIPERDLFTDKQSGKDFERPAYRCMLRKLKEGDLVVVKSIDRLGRNYEEILDQWRIITKKIHADIKVLDMPLLDTRQNVDLTGTLIADLVLQLLSYVAQAERESIRQRQAEGIAAARQRGVRFGRPSMVVPEAFDETYTRWLAGEITSRKAGELLGTSQTTFLNWVRRHKENQEF
ncbi:MAG: recombinase family protein [Firmicutes bacterium]|nr:recombinase family protein [Bacillota bacterium]